MQYLLSGYANWFNTRHRRPGHLVQGRFKGELIEDDRYFWNVSRYLHLNPVRGKRHLVERPEDWPWSSSTKHSKSQSRDVAAWLARRLTVATLRELAEPFGLGHPDNVRGLVDRTEKAMARSPKLRREIEQLKQQLKSR